MDRSQIQNLIGGTVVDSEGKDAGKIGMVYLDDETNEPDWVSVNTGLFGNKETFVPLEGARADGDNLHVPFTKAQIKDAPNVDADEHLDVEHEQKLYRHYGRDYGSQRDGDRRDGAADGHGRQDHDHGDDRNVAAATHDRQDHDVTDRDGDRDRMGDVTDRDGDRDRMGDDRDRDREGEGVTLHEERLDVGTERRETGKARLRKYVVTEEKSVTVPVSHEEVRVEREPVSGRHAGDAKIGEEVQEVTLHEEVPVVGKDTVATEEVRLSTDQVTEEKRVSEEVRREEVDVDGVDDHDRPGRHGDRDVDDARRRDGDVDDARHRRDGDGHDDRSLKEKAKDKLS